MVDEKGEARIQRVYTGMYYVPEVGKNQRIIHRLMQLVLWARACTAFIFGAAKQGTGNNEWYLGLCQVVDIVSLVWAASGLFNYLIASPKMTVGEWKTSAQRTKYASICSFLALAVTGMLSLLDLWISKEGTAAHLMSASCFALAGLCMAVMWIVERRTVYKMVPSGEHAPGYAAQIR